MSDEKKNLSEENETESVNTTLENLEGVGQVILGEIEKVGGMLTANPTAQAEGEYNIEVGKMHMEVAEELAETESEEE